MRQASRFGLGSRVTPATEADAGLAACPAWWPSRRRILLGFATFAALSCAHEARQRSAQFPPEVRPFVVRFSDENHATCTVAGDGVRCTEALTPRVIKQLGERSAAVRGSAPTSQRLAAMLDLAVPGGPRVSAAADALVALALTNPDDAAAQSDAAAALFVRAGLVATPSDLLLAFDLVDRSLTIDPQYAPALFNRAMILERLSLVGQAADAWRRALDTHDRGWRQEVSRRLTAVSTILSERESPGSHTSPNALSSALAANDAERLRDYLFERVVPHWTGGPFSAAEVETIALLGRASSGVGDSSVAIIARALAAATPQTLATAHRGFRAFLAAQEHSRAGRHSIAVGPLQDAISALASVGAPTGTGLGVAADWFAVRLGTLRLYGSDFQAADSIHRAVLERSRGRAGLGGLAGHAAWGLSLSSYRQGRVALAADEMQLAVRAFASSGDRVSRGSVQTQLVELLESLGLRDQALQSAIDGLAAIRADRSSGGLRHGLLGLAYALERMGALSLALAAQYEYLNVVAPVGDPEAAAEGFLRLGRLAAAAGQPSVADSAFRRSLAALPGVDDRILGPRLRSDLAEAVANANVERDPHRALAEADSAIKYYGRAGIRIKMAPLLALSGRIRLSVGDSIGAREAFRHSARLLDQVTPGRSFTEGLTQTRRDAYRQLIELSAALGDSLEALRYVARMRNAPQAGTVESTDPVITFAFTEGTVLRWVQSGREVAMRKLAVTPSDLRRQVAEFTLAVRSGADSLVIRDRGARLFRLLFAGLGPLPSRVVVAPDDAMSQLPFAAMTDPADGRYLIEGSAVIVLTSGRAPPTFRVGGVIRTLVIDGSGFDRDAFPELGPLPGAATEAQAIAGLRPGTQLLSGKSATAEAILEALPEYEVVHFAGHARSEVGGLERSFLVAGGGGGTKAGSLVTGAAIARLDLRGTKVVVLSSCGAVGGPAIGTSAGHTLAGAILAAGAESVISSLWEVQDNRTLELAVTIQSNLFPDPAVALQRAQLAVLAGPSSTGRHPRVWATFRIEF